MKHRLIIYLLFAAICLITVSCKDDILPGEDKATVNIFLQAEKGCGDVNDAEVCLNYQTKTKTSSVKMEKYASGCYTAKLPCNSMPVNNFIEVNLEDRIYAFTPEKTCLEGGKLYEYSLVVTSNGLVNGIGFDITVNDWEVIEITGDFKAVDK